MINIQQAVKDAIDEFGKFAHERFRCKVDNGDWHTPLRNEMLLMWLNDNKIVIELKALPELFEHDVSFYGADAYLMWEQYHTPESKWYNAGNNNFILFNQNIRRKTSAALPFDIERAIAGDAVECLYHRTHQVIPCTLTDKLGDAKNGIAVCCDGELFIAQERELRMKYPKKAAK